MGPLGGRVSGAMEVDTDAELAALGSTGYRPSAMLTSLESGCHHSCASCIGSPLVKTPVGVRR